MKFLRYLKRNFTFISEFLDGTNWAKKTITEFSYKCPDKCVICSYHAYGLNNYYTDKPVEPHFCIENYSRWSELGKPKEDFNGNRKTQS